jgi:hypothetical protein
MKCREYASSLMELARGRVLEAEDRRAVLAHVEHCVECAERLDGERSMQAAVERLAAEEAPEEQQILTRVLAEFDRAAALRRRTRMSVTRWVFVAGLAASVLLASFWTLRTTPVKPSAAADEEAPFVTIPYTIPLAPEERAEVVRMRIPVTALLAAGFHVQVSDPSTAIDAEVLVSQDGRARAIRPLTVAMSD